METEPTMSDFPQAWVLRSTRVKDYRIVEVECPLCPNVHKHGADNGKRGSLGHKVAHCWNPYNRETKTYGYVIYDDTPLNGWER